MALLALKSSSRKANSASGSIPEVTVATVPSRSLTRSIGPNTSFGSENRVRRYSKYRPSTAVANARIRADLAVPGGPNRNRCSPATTASAIRSITSSRPTYWPLSGSVTVARNRCEMSSLTAFSTSLYRRPFLALLLKDELQYFAGAPGFRHPCRAVVRCQTFRVKQFYPRVSAERQVPVRPLGNVRERACQRPPPKCRGEPSHQYILRVLRTGPPVNGHGVPQGQVDRQVRAGRCRAVGRLQKFRHHFFRLVAGYGKPAR